jgi:protein required for attachment to host cells
MISGGPMPTTWILIADGAKARLVTQGRHSRRFEPASERAFFGTTAQSKEIASDRPGRSFDSGGEGRHAMEPPTDPQRYAKFSFARDLANHLIKAAGENRFDSLILVAAPKTLGDLRELLPATVRGKVKAEIDKDLTNVKDQDLGKHLDSYLKPSRPG